MNQDAKEKLKETLYREMMAYDAGDPARIQHFVKVHSFAQAIGKAEKLEEEIQFILECAALVHDIGIKPAEAKYGKSDGKFQEQEGPAEAENTFIRISDDRRRTEIQWLLFSVIAVSYRSHAKTMCQCLQITVATLNTGRTVSAVRCEQKLNDQFSVFF